ncbi:MULTISPECIES: AAA family ATPase [Catenuloplanes]|uniref:AAA family ATPase n=1 Tax=Catenuloplanes TaxID=33874 RepID=UPI0035B512C7
MSREHPIGPVCLACGRAAAPDDRFCGGCGASLQTSCVHCGRAHQAGVLYCTGCGRPLTDAQPVVQEERRRISVLFIDLVGFTPYTERIDPEQVRIMQNDYFSSVRRIVRQYGGVVEKYIGDAVMVLFGAPVATEADPLRSVRAGLELQRVLPKQGRAQQAGLRFRVGITTGEALVNLTAAHDGGQAIVAGDLVNTASRLQAAAPVDGVLTDDETYQATKNEIEYVAQPTTTLRGRSRPSDVWLAVAPRPPRPAGAEREQTPMVDREHELALLVNALRRTVSSRTPQLVTIFGSAGIGKSRLLRELARHAGRITGEQVCWRVGQCRPFGENVTYAALADIVKSQAGILDTDDEATARQRLGDALAGLTSSEDAQRLADALGPLLGLPGARLTPGESESAWRRFIVRFSSGQATVLVFEDLHWADAPMLRFIESLGAATRRIPLLIVCTARPELRERYPQWTSAMTGTTSISLPPMRESDISTMYSLMFGKAAFTPDLLAPLVELADGNPLYAHEYVRMLVDHGSLRPTGGPGWRLDAHEAPPMPDNVRAVIANRLDLLDPADRAVLQAAAVVGMQFWPGAVATAVGQPVEEVERTLLRLEQRDLVEERGNSSMAGQLEYAFRHVLVRDVCYQRLPRAERVARHERTADWLERVSDGRQTDLAEVLANHRWAAHEIARTLGLDPGPYAAPAREALLRAARRAYSLHALDAAQELVRRASSLLAAPDPAVELFASELAFFRDADAFLDGGGEERLTALAHTLQDSGRLDGAGRAWTLLGSAALSRADRPACLAYLARAIALYEKLPPSEEAALALLEYARVHMIDYETATAIAAAETAAEAANRLGLAEVRASALITSAVAQYLQGEQEGLRRLQKITQHCREQQLTSLRRAIHNLGFAMQEEGDITGSQKLIDEFTPLESASGLTLATAFVDGAARAYFAGDWAAMLRAADDHMRLPTIEWDLHWVAQAGWMGVLREDSPPVEDPVEEAVRTARRSGFHKVLRSTLAHAALCRALQGRSAEAGALLDELAADYGDSRTLAFAEWVFAAAYAAWLLGPARADQIRTLLERSPRRTPWVDAAILTCTGTSAAHRAALTIFDDIGAVSDQALSRAALVRTLRAEGDPTGAAEALAPLTAFSERNSAPGLLRLAEPLP